MRRRRGEPNNDQVVEAVRLLNAMPAFEALHALDSVRNIADGAKILEMLQGDMHGKQRPSDISTAKSLTASSSMALELLARHPTMYLSIHANDYVYSHVSGIHPARLDHLIQAGSPRRLHLSVNRPALLRKLSSLTIHPDQKRSLTYHPAWVVVEASTLNPSAPHHPTRNNLPHLLSCHFAIANRPSAITVCIASAFAIGQKLRYLMIWRPASYRCIFEPIIHYSASSLLIYLSPTSYLTKTGTVLRC